jgi:glyoxylase-like metal-dependent hydrolase (beta-lactamase superfamily II)
MLTRSLPSGPNAKLIDEVRSPTIHPALAGLTVLERGWLSSNNLLIPDDSGLVMVDSGHVVHAAQTLALVRHVLATMAADPARSAPSAQLTRVLNTHLHSDHCGGNAALQREFGAAVQVPASMAEAVADWDLTVLNYDHIGQRCERFSAQGVLTPGESLRLGGRVWDVLAAPGHDPDSVMLFDSSEGVLVSADALWENGFGVVFPELAGEPAFDDVAAVLDLIASLSVAVVVPGHGAPFSDVAGALTRARRRLAGWRADPQRHRRHAARVLLKYHLMEEGSQSLPDLLAWARGAPFVGSLWRATPGASTLSVWVDSVVAELCGSGAARLCGDQLHNT